MFKSIRLLQLFVLIAVLFLSASLLANLSQAQHSSLSEQSSAYVSDRKDQDITLYFFWGDGCPHCKNQQVFLNQLSQRFTDLKIESFEIYHNRDNLEKMLAMGKEIGAQPRGVPFTIVGSRYFEGFDHANTTGRQIEKELENLFLAKQMRLESLDKSLDLELADGAGVGEKTQVSDKAQNEAVLDRSEDKAVFDKSDLIETVSLPIFGEISVASLSLPLFTIIIAGLDGFNPCAMWALIFLIGILFDMKNRKRMWILGSAFILTSGAVYFLFLSAWLNVFLFVGFVSWIRILIGFLALGAGGYYLYDAYANRDGECKVSQGEKKQKMFAKIKNFAQQQNFWVALAGIMLLAIGVNMIELVCSAGLPAIYTQVLTLSELSMSEYYSYLGLYILVFMLDDLLIFFTAMFTLQIAGIQGKYARYSHIVGGFLMFILGLLLIFKPEYLMFG